MALGLRVQYFVLCVTALVASAVVIAGKCSVDQAEQLQNNVGVDTMKTFDKCVAFSAAYSCDTCEPIFQQVYAVAPNCSVSESTSLVDLALQGYNTCRGKSVLQVEKSLPSLDHLCRGSPFALLHGTADADGWAKDEVEAVACAKKCQRDAACEAVLKRVVSAQFMDDCIQKNLHKINATCKAALANASTTLPPRRVPVSTGVAVGCSAGMMTLTTMVVVLAFALSW